MAMKGLLLLLAIISLMSVYSAREFPQPSLQISGFGLSPGAKPLGQLDCWSALTEIRACSHEIVAYLINGTLDISQPCCQAISVITHRCWPAVLTTLGYTPDQTFILRGYCDATVSHTAEFGPVASPVGQPLPAEMGG